ncbi:MAG: hypothetical protein RMI90_01235 [Thermoguttaceae bacterium]|nr:hypothetical protein [Thermoguttaceae bacterium]
MGQIGCNSTWIEEADSGLGGLMAIWNAVLPTGFLPLEADCPRSKSAPGSFSARCVG